MSEKKFNPPVLEKYGFIIFIFIVLIFMAFLIWIFSDKDNPIECTENQCVSNETLQEKILIWNVTKPELSVEKATFNCSFSEEKSYYEVICFNKDSPISYPNSRYFVPYLSNNF